MASFIVALLVVSACSLADGEPVQDVPATGTTLVVPATVAEPSVSTTLADLEPTSQVPTTGCRSDGGVPWQSGEPVEMQTLIDESGVVVRGLVYPRPDYNGRPWSQWGQGLVLGDGTHLSAIGDHLGPDGNAYVYEYDPGTKQLRQIADVLSLVEHVPGDWGFGKVHGQIVAGPCDDAYFATYWGNRRDLVYTDSYQGDRLFRLDPALETVEDLGVIYPERGIPSLASWPGGGLIYAEAVDPSRSPNQGEFLAVDATTGELVFADSETSHVGFRSIAVDAQGRAYFAKGDGRLAVFDPESMTISEYPGELPGGWLRAATTPTEDGTIYGATREPDMLFSLSPDGTVVELNSARGYVASLVADPSGETVYYVPEAHGRSFMQGAPVIAVDTTTGADRVVVEMNEAAEAVLGVRLGGTYNMSISADGSTLFIGMNAGPLEDDGGFGEVVLLEVTLP